MDTLWLKQRPQARVLACLMLAAVSVQPLQTAAAEALAPANPQASAEARRVLAYLQSVQGRQTLAGHHVIYGPAAERELAYIVDTTGKHPALIEFEAGIFTRKYGDRYAAGQDAVVRAATDYWQAGGLVAICWHWGNPLEPENTYPNTKVAFDIEAALSAGTPEHAALLKDLDVTASLLKELREARVPVLWRPLHEMCGGWFWWSMQGRETAQHLWRFLYTYFTEEHKLDNLLWVYSASHDLRLDWFPGLAYTDVLGVDIYREGQQAERRYYDQLTSIAEGKPVVLSECDLIPEVEVTEARGFAWGWVTTWHGRYVRKNGPENLKRFYTSERVVTRDELPDLHNPDAPRISPEQPVPGTGERSASALIIDSQGRTLKLTFDAPPRAATTDRWFQRMEAYDKEHALARARDEALRQEWMAQERERAEQEAARQAAEQAWARQTPTYGTAYWLGGGGGRRHDRPSRGRQRSSTRPEVSPLRPIFLPTPNLTSPFPRSQPKPPPASNKSFLP